MAEGVAGLEGEIGQGVDKGVGEVEGLGVAPLVAGALPGEEEVAGGGFEVGGGGGAHGVGGGGAGVGMGMGGWMAA